MYFYALLNLLTLIFILSDDVWLVTNVSSHKVISYFKSKNLSIFAEF